MHKCISDNTHNHYSFIHLSNYSILSSRQPEELFKAFDCSEMKLNPDLSDITMTTKHSSKKTQMICNDDNWKASCIEIAVKNATDFVAQTEPQVQFKFSSLDKR